MAMISSNDIFICILGSMLKAMPVPNSVNTTILSPLLITNITFVGMGACPVTGIPTPCVPTILPWLLPSQKFLIKGMPAIMHGMSMAMCARGGLIKAIPMGKPPIMLLG